VLPRYRTLIANLFVKLEVEVDPTNSAEIFVLDTVNFVNPFLGSLFLPIHSARYPASGSSVVHRILPKP
jgi:hypothetical protein